MDLDDQPFDEWRDLVHERPLGAPAHRNSDAVVRPGDLYGDVRAYLEAETLSPATVSKFEAGERRLEVCEFIDLCAAVDGDAAEIVRRIMR
jgi:hypothetical protein